MEEVYAPGKWNSHLSDDAAAIALAHNGSDRQAPPAAGESVPKTPYVSRSQRELNLRPGRTGAACTELTSTAASVVIGGLSVPLAGVSSIEEASPASLSGLTGPASTVGPGGVRCSHHYGGGGRSAPPAAPLTQAPQGLRQGLGTLESRENTVLSPHPTGVATEC